MQCLDAPPALKVQLTTVPQHQFYSAEDPTCTVVSRSGHSRLLYSISVPSLCPSLYTYSIMETGADVSGGRSDAHFDAPVAAPTHSADATSSISNDRHLLTTVNSSSDRTGISSGSICLIPYDRNPRYAHRKLLEEEIQDRLSVPGARVALVGLGGMGYVFVYDGGLLHG